MGDRRPITSGAMQVLNQDDTRRDSSAAYWEQQAHLYATELQRIYHTERTEREALQAAHAQLIRYAEDVRLTFQAERARRQQLQQAYLETIRMLAASVEARDPYTGGHLERVTRYCLVTARQLGWKGEQVTQIEMAAILHDIGKINIDDAILRKPSPLTDDEWTQMRVHPVIGAQILSGISFLGPIVPYVRHHHERFDGGGYPDGLAGQEIPIGSRLIAVADSFDAMTSTRPYRKGRPAHEAIEEIRKFAGVQFDPDVVAAFVRAYNNGDIVTELER